MLSCYHPAQPPPGLLSPVRPERSPSLFIGLSTLAQALPPTPCHGAQSVQAWSLPFTQDQSPCVSEVLRKHCERPLGVSELGRGDPETSVQPLAIQAVRVCPVLPSSPGQVLPEAGWQQTPTRFSEPSSEALPSLPPSRTLLLCRWGPLGERICQTSSTQDTVLSRQRVTQ